jgi:hypothetical protein
MISDSLLPIFWASRLDEFAFRYSHRREKYLLFNIVLANCEPSRP